MFKEKLKSQETFKVWVVPKVLIALPGLSSRSSIYYSYGLDKELLLVQASSFSSKKQLITSFL